MSAIADEVVLAGRHWPDRTVLTVKMGSRAISVVICRRCTLAGLATQTGDCASPVASLRLCPECSSKYRAALGS